MLLLHKSGSTWSTVCGVSLIVPKDIGAGLTLAMVAIPDSIASAILSGVNPILAFNSMMTGMPVAGLGPDAPEYAEIGAKG